MGSHDDYGKQVLRAAAGPAYTDWGVAVQVDYRAGKPARIDGAVGSSVAVEVESRVSKQVRGALLDLICHPRSKKLLILLPVHMSDAEITAEQCRFILEKFVTPANFRVVVLQGTGDDPCFDTDVPTIKQALGELGFT